MRSAQALHIRALLYMSRSSGEMKFNSSSCMLKPVYFGFVKTMLELFLETTHFVKSRAHSPRLTSKIIAMIALRRAILMKANPVVSLHAHRLFSGRACSCKKDPCSNRLVSICARSNVTLDIGLHRSLWTYGRRAYNDVLTKFSRIDRLPHFLCNGALPGRTWNFAMNLSHKDVI